MKEAENETQQKHYEVDVRNIKPLERTGGNIRTDYGDLDGSFLELVNSIAENGIKVPIRAYRDKEREGGWIAIDGHRRLKAAMKLVEDRNITVRTKLILVDLKTISDEQLVIDMVVTNTGKPLSPLELSEAVRRLSGYGLKPKDIASKFGMNAHAIRNLQLLGSAPKRIRELIASNKLRYTVALDFIKTSSDYNDAIDKIEKAFSVSAAEKKASKKSSDSIEETETPELSITRKHLNEVNNKVDFTFELKQVFKRQLDKPKEIKNQELFSFCKKLVENRLTANDIERLIF